MRLYTIFIQAKLQVHFSKCRVGDFHFPLSSLSLRFITARSNMDLIIIHDLVASTFVSQISIQVIQFK